MARGYTLALDTNRNPTYMPHMPHAPPATNTETPAHRTTAHHTPAHRIPAPLQQVNGTQRIGSVWLDLWLEHRDQLHEFPSAPRSVVEGYAQSVKTWALWCEWGASSDPQVRAWGVRPAFRPTTPTPNPQPSPDPTTVNPTHPLDAAEKASVPATPPGFWVWAYGESLEAALERKASAKFPGALVRALMRGGVVGLPFTLERSGRGRASLSPVRGLTVAEAESWIRAALSGLPYRGDHDSVPAVASTVVWRLGRERFLGSETGPYRNAANLSTTEECRAMVLDWLVGVVSSVWRGGFGGRPRRGM